MDTETVVTKRGTVLAPDDFNIGQNYMVYGMKDCQDQPIPIQGQSFECKAINLPFVVGKLFADPAHPAITFDVRQLLFMRATDEYVKAQKPE